MKPAIASIILILVCGSVLTAQQPPAYVNLIPQQTPLRNQGGRTTCITFASLAALEAAYKRAGYGDIDLSEQFLNYLGKTFWLDPKWNDILARGEDGKEAQVGAYGGGQAVSYIRGLASGLKVPEEAAMPYVSREYNANDFPALSHNWDDPYWLKQKRMSDFNLDTRFLPNAALIADKYYSIKSYQELNGNDVNALERVLASGKELAWDIDGAFPNTPVWDVCSNCQTGAHAMLIVGYDRRDPDPKKHVFIIKNTWGATRFPDGYTRVTYDYVKKYGLRAAYITEVNPPGRWYELGFVGRWFMDFDGHKGILDIYHLPHVSEYVFRNEGVNTADMRVGSFYENGKAFKVNGVIEGQSIRFYIDPDNPNMRWDILKGRMFSFALLQDKGNVMAGTFRDTDGKVYGGYARKDNAAAYTNIAINDNENSSYYRGSWLLRFGGMEARLQVREPAENLREQTGVYDVFRADLSVDGKSYEGKLLVEKNNLNHILLQAPQLLANNKAAGHLDGLRLNFNKATVAGKVLYEDRTQSGFIMTRLVRGL
ncbi:MAG: C1 family peptidase [Chitinophagaceae bacterium]|nr:C1 family peptidase [Chitinophagaceae bacterium]